MIHLTYVAQPEVGGVILHHCSGCQRTEIYVSEFAVKPFNGDVLHVEVPCVVHAKSTFNIEFRKVTVGEAMP